jgi:hypothetical protein
MMGGLLGMAAAAGGAPFGPGIDFEDFDFPMPMMPAGF